MTTRLLWNFELDNRSSIHPMVLDAQSSTSAIDAQRWEARYFWPKTSIIVLTGLSHNLLDLRQSEIKQHQDCYYLLRNQPYNIKRRRLKLLYKPLIAEKDNRQAFSKKINLITYTSDDKLPGATINAACLRTLIDQYGQAIEVMKTALIYKFPCKPTIRMELARLTIADRHYFSACIEGYSQLLVTAISNAIFPQENCCNYIHFLQRF